MPTSVLILLIILIVIIMIFIIIILIHTRKGKAIGKVKGRKSIKAIGKSKNKFQSKWRIQRKHLRKQQ